MAEPPVCNASPLIYLSRAGRLHLLKAAGSVVIVPAGVMDEVCAKGPSDATVRAIEACDWLRFERSPAIPREVDVWGLGRGESLVLAWSLQHDGAEAILDDLLARRCAAALGIPCVGTLGIVIRAKRLGLVPAARPVIEELVRHRMYLSPKIVAEALGLIGE